MIVVDPVPLASVRFLDGSMGFHRTIEPSLDGPSVLQFRVRCDAPRRKGKQ